jgi:hypothetical protein
MADVLAAFPQIKSIRRECNVPPMINKDDFNQMIMSVKKIGLRDPIWVNEDGELLDGRAKLAVAFLLQIDPKIQKTDEDPIDIAWINLARSHFSKGQKAVVASELLAMEREAATKRRHANLKKGNEIPECDNCRTRETATGRASDIAGGRVGVSGKSVERAAKLSPDLKEKVKTGELSLNAAAEANEKRTKATVRPNSKTISPKKSTNPNMADQVEVRYEGATFTIVGAANCPLEMLVYEYGEGEWHYLRGDNWETRKTTTRDLAIKHAKSMVANFFRDGSQE